MSSFFGGNGSSGDPTAPPGNDSFSGPTPDWQSIGYSFAKGQQDAQGPSLLKSLFTDPLTAIQNIVTWALGTFLSLVLCIVAYLIALLNKIDEQAAPGLNAVALNSLAHVFQIPVPGSTKTSGRVGESLSSPAAALGKTITDTFKAGLAGSGAGGIVPSSAGADAFLGLMARIGVEGWVEGALTEVITAGQLKAMMELVPLMSETLGFSRLSRRALAAPMKILVEDPYTWLLNAQYRPTLLSHDVATRQYFRGKMNLTDLQTELGRQGFSNDRIEALINVNTKRLALADIDYLFSRGALGLDQAASRLSDDGYDDATAREFLQLAQQRRLDSLNTELLAAYTAAFERGEIDLATWTNAANNAPLTEGEKAVLAGLVLARRTLNVKHLTLAEVEAMIKKSIMTIDDLRTWMTRENYPVDEQVLLELYLVGNITDAADAAKKKQQLADQRAAAAAARLKAQQDKAAAAAAKLQTAGESLAQYESLVTSGLRTFDQYKSFLASRGIQPAVVQDLVDLLHQKIDAADAKTKAHQALVDEADQKHVPLATTEKSVIAGTLTIADLTRFMTNLEYTADDIAIATGYVQEQLDAKAAKAKAKADATAKAQEKNISLPTLERAARLGLTTVAAYGSALDAAGFTPEARDLMVGILNDQIATDAAAVQKRKDAIAKAAKKKISLAALEQAVIDGLRPIDDYRTELSTLGFDLPDIDTMAALLQLRVDHAKAVADKKAQAAVKLKERNLSLAELERAVKLGVLSIDEYTAELGASGFSAEDQQVLRLSLLADVQKVAQAQQLRIKVAAAVKKKGVDLAQETQLVRAGLETLDGYQLVLTNAGYSEHDATELRALLADEIAQAKSASEKRAAAEQKAADKDISLANEEKAVIDGIRSMDDYNALLADLGFNELDQATLDALLQEKISTAQAQAAAAAAPGVPGTPPAKKRKKKAAAPPPLPPTP